MLHEMLHVLTLAIFVRVFVSLMSAQLHCPVGCSAEIGGSCYVYGSICSSTGNFCWPGSKVGYFIASESSSVSLSYGLSVLASAAYDPSVCDVQDVDTSCITTPIQNRVGCWGHTISKIPTIANCDTADASEHEIMPSFFVLLCALICVLLLIIIATDTVGNSCIPLCPCAGPCFRKAFIRALKGQKGVFSTRDFQCFFVGGFLISRASTVLAYGTT